MMCPSHSRTLAVKPLLLGLALLACTLALLGSWAQPVAAQDVETLRVGVIPALTEGTTREGIQRLRDHLERELDMPVNLTVYADYAAVVEGLGFKHIDMAYLGPRTYVIAHHRYGVRPIITQLVDGTPFYHSYFIARVDSPLESLDELKGKTVAFADPSSTSGSLIPKLALIRRGIDPNRDLRALHTGAHDATALAVQHGQVDAGAIDSAYFNTLIRQGHIDGSAFKVFWRSEPLFQYPWVVRADMDEGLVVRIQRAFLSVDDPVIFAAFGASGFTVTADPDYEIIRQAAREFGDI